MSIPWKEPSLGATTAQKSSLWRTDPTLPLCIPAVNAGDSLWTEANSPKHRVGFLRVALKPTDLPLNQPRAEIIFAIQGHGGGCCNKQDYVLKYSQGVTPVSQFFCKCLSLILRGAGTPPDPYSCWHLLGFYANDNFAFLMRYFSTLWLLQASVNLCRAG